MSDLNTLRDEPPPHAELRADPGPDIVSRHVVKLSRSDRRRKAIKIAISLVLVIGFGFVPVRAMLQSSSVEAVLNRRVITLRAPIEGELALSADTRLRSLTITN